MNRRQLALVAVGLFLGLSLPVAASDDYTIILSNSQTGARWWDAPYLRVLSPGVGWTDGDRSGYRCAYGFLYRDNRRGQQTMIGRFTFSRIDGAADYARVNDKGMAEGIRYYDGTLDRNDAGGRELGDCPSANASYEPFAGNQLPTIRFVQNGQTLETRDYKALVVGEGITFQQVSKSESRIGVVAYHNGLPVIEIYYDSLVRSVTLTSDLG